MTQDGYRLLLPEGLLDYFHLLKVEEQPKLIKIYLEEKNNINPVGRAPLYESKGFYPNVLAYARKATFARHS